MNRWLRLALQTAFGLLLKLGSAAALRLLDETAQPRLQAEAALNARH